MAKTCENCGERVYSLGCVNCNEPAYIEEQERLTALYGIEDDDAACRRDWPIVLPDPQRKD